MTARKRPYGGGSIYEDKGGWTATMPLPPDPATGKRRRLSAHGKTKTQARRRLEDKADRLRRTGRLDRDEKPLLSDWLDYWLDEIEAPRIRANSMSIYRNSVGRWKRVAGAVRIDRLTPVLLRQAQRDAAVGVSLTTAKKDWGILRGALRAAVRERVIDWNPTDAVDAPRAPKPDIEILSADQAAELIGAEPDPMWKAQWTLAFLGLRRGERLGLTAGQLVVRDNVKGLVVDRQLQEFKEPPAYPADQAPHVTPLGGMFYLVPVKAAGSARFVPLPDGLWSYLTAVEPGVGGLLFHRGGTPINYADLWRHWRKALDRVGLPHVRQHSARHTAASILARLGVPVDARLAIIGHTSLDIDAVYIHTTTTELDGAMKALTSELKAD